MGRETPGGLHEEAGREMVADNDEQLRKEARQTAQELSHRWGDLRNAVEADSSILDENPELWHVYDMGESPVSGIQKWFEGQMEDIEGLGDLAKSSALIRVKSDLERIGGWVDRALSGN